MYGKHEAAFGKSKNINVKPQTPLILHRQIRLLTHLKILYIYFTKNNVPRVKLNIKNNFILKLGFD